MRRCASLITLLTIALAMLAPTAAFAADWTVGRLILVFDDGASTYDSADDPGALTPISGADYRLWTHPDNVLHVSCSTDLTVDPGAVVDLNGDTLIITDFYLDSVNPGGQNTPPCGNPDLLEEPELCPEGTDHAGRPLDEGPCDDPELCPEGTDHAGTPIDEVEDCDNPEDEPELCPEGTDHAGTPIDEVEDCDDPEEEPELCPEGTLHEGVPVDDVDDCDPDPVVVEDLVCPESSDFPGMLVEDLDDCTEVAVLPVVIEREDDEDGDDTEVLGVTEDRRELARTGADSPQSLLVLGLLLLGLGGETLRRTRRA